MKLRSVLTKSDVGKFFLVLTGTLLMNVSLIRAQGEAAPPQKNTDANSYGKSGLVRVTTDAHGHVVKAVMLKSVGSKVLDDNTVSWALEHWTGPANSTAVVPITYRRDRPLNK